MIKQFAITVQPQITATNPDSYKIELCKGILSSVVIRPANGPNWEVYTRILHFENAIIPDDNDEWIPLERISLAFAPMFTDWKDIYNMTIEICSPQARFAHTIQYEITVNELATTEELLTDFIAKGFKNPKQAL